MTFFSRACFFIFIFLFALVMPRSAEAFQVAPSRQTAVLDPGTVQVIPLAVFNDSDAPQMFTPEIDAFIVDSKTGSPIFGREDEAMQWFRVLPERLLLQSGQTGTFSFTASIPNTAEVKSHYLGLFARSESGDGQIGVSTRLGSLLFLHIAGDVREELVRKTFSSDTLFYRGGDATIRLAFENIGTIHVIPEGVVTVRDRSGEEIATFPLNPDERKVLPGGIWEAEYRVSDLSSDHVGLVRVSVDAVYGLSQKEIHDTTTFWFISDAMFFLGIAAIVGVLFAVFFLPRGRMKKKSKKVKR